MGDINKYNYGLHLINKYDYKDRNTNIDIMVTYMMNKTHSMFKYTGLPDTIPERMLELYIQNNGHCCIAEYNGELYAFTGGMGGEPDEYYMPTEYIVANPALKLNKTYKIDNDCVVIPNDTMYMGLLPIHHKYASMLAENEISVFMAMYNTRIMSILSAGDDRTKESVKHFIESIIAGKPSYIAETAILDSLKTYPWSNSNTNTLKPLIENEQYWRATWFNELGLNANFNMKRERINSSETELNVDALKPLVTDMFECRIKAIDRINEMFGTNIIVELNSAWSDNDDMVGDKNVGDNIDNGTDIQSSAISDNSVSNNINDDNDNDTDIDNADDNNTDIGTDIFVNIDIDTDDEDGENDE